MPAHYRSLPLDQERSVDTEARTVALSFASETPAIQIYRGRKVREILDVSEKAMDLSRMQGAPLLVNHDESLLVGSVRSARVDADRKARAVVKFGNSTRAKEEFQDVQEGHRTGVSFGYKVNEIEEMGVIDGMETIRVRSYTPFEISLVTFAADRHIGFGRGENNEEFPVIIMRNINLSPDPPVVALGGNPTPPAAPPTPPSVGNRVTVEQAVKQAREAEKVRIREIEATAKRFNLPGIDALAEDSIANGDSLDVFRAKLLEHEDFGARPVTTAETGVIGMSRKDVENYSLTRAILRMGIEKKPLDGLERECSEEVATRIGRKPNGFFMPMDVVVRSFAESKGLGKSDHQRILEQIAMVRALTSNVHNAGGALVGTDLLGSSLIELLRNQMFVMQMGARNLTGLVGDVAIPRQTGGATCFWLAQGSTLTRTQQVVDQLGLTPHRLAASTAYDKQLLSQSSVAVEAFVREDLMSILAIEKDRAALNGTGVNGEPAGLLRLSGSSTLVTFATAAKPLFTDVVQMETNLAAANADRGRLGYLVTPAARGFAKVTAKINGSGTGGMIWENDSMNGFPARATNQVPSGNSVLFGRWDDLIVADWDGLDVVVDPYTLSLTGQISVVLQMLTDVGIRHAKSFTWSTN